MIERHRSNHVADSHTISTLYVESSCGRPRGQGRTPPRANSRDRLFQLKESCPSADRATNRLRPTVNAGGGNTGASMPPMARTPGSRFAKDSPAAACRVNSTPRASPLANLGRQLIAGGDQAIGYLICMARNPSVCANAAINVTGSNDAWRLRSSISRVTPRGCLVGRFRSYSRAMLGRSNSSRTAGVTIASLRNHDPAERSPAGPATIVHRHHASGDGER